MSLATEFDTNDRDPDFRLCRLLRVDSLDETWLVSLTQEDWSDIVRSADWHTLAPLLYSRIKAASYMDHVPEDILGELRKRYLYSLSRGVFSMHVLGQLLHAFQEDNLDVIPLKGAHLAEIVYQNPALRYMSDLDLLFRKADLPRVVDCLVSRGYQSAKPFWIEYQCQVSHELPIFHKSESPPVEVHWTIILPTLHFDIDLEDLWGRAVSYPFLGSKALFLSPEDLLLHLSIHATTQHLLRNGLRMIYDVAAALSHYQNELDWDILLRRARQWKADRATYLMFCMANQFFGAPFPNGFLEELEPEEFNPEIMNVAKDLVIIKEKPFSSFSPKLAGLLAAKSPLAKINHLFRRIFIPPGEMALIYPVTPGSLRLLLYYPVRVVDAVSKHYKSGLKLLRGEPATIESARDALTRAEQENWLVKALSDR